MILAKFFGAIQRPNSTKLANLFWEADPIAQDAIRVRSGGRAAQEAGWASSSTAGSSSAVSGRSRTARPQVAKLTAQAKAYLKAATVETA